MTEEHNASWPVKWLFATTPGPGKEVWVAVTLQFPLGTFTTCAPPEVAEQMAEQFPAQLREAAKVARREASGIVLPSSLAPHPLKGS